MPSRQAKHWCFTINNYGASTEETLRGLGQQDCCVYLVFGREVGQEGTKHLQGYVAFKQRKALGPVKTLLGGTAHLEPAKGSPAQASEYCKKDKDFEEYGQVPAGKGHRSDLTDVLESIKRGDSLQRIAEEHPAAALRYGSGILRVRQLFRPKRDKPPELHCFWGRTGTGKTRRVWEFMDPEKLWVHPGHGWFDGYDDHDAVLFDDFDGGWFKITYLLKLLDRYQFQVPIKGGHTWWAPRHILITANVHPREWYPQAKEEHQRALIRRLNEFGSIQECHGSMI